LRISVNLLKILYELVLQRARMRVSPLLLIAIFIAAMMIFRGFVLR
jgi:hypothetical protein